MANIERIAERVPTSSTLFGNSPYQTYPPSQGSVQFYQDSTCSLPLGDNATPLIVGQCLNAPISSIKGVSLSTLPTCSDYGTPLLIVSNVPDCKNSTAGTGADGGVVGKCESFSSGTDIGSVELVCFGNGISSVKPTAAAATTTHSGYSSTSAPTTEASATSNTNTNSDEDEEDNDGGDSGCCGCECCGNDCCQCCQCCVVM